jgi:hypothetical protein
MKEKEYITINNKLLCIDRYYYESDEMFYFRVNYIVNTLSENNNSDDLDNIIGLSKIEQEKKFNKCLY